MALLFSFQTKKKRFTPQAPLLIGVSNLPHWFSAI